MDDDAPLNDAQQKHFAEMFDAASEIVRRRDRIRAEHQARHRNDALEYAILTHTENDDE